MEALSGAASRLHGDRDLWTRLSVAGQEGVRAKHDPANYVRRIETIYAEVSEERAQSGS